MRKSFLVVFALLVICSLASARGRRLGSCCSPVYYAYPTYSYYPSYTPAYTAPAYETAPTYSSNWQAEAMAYARQKDDHLAFFGAMRALGVNGAILDYGYGGAFAQKALSAPVQGDTIYGYSYSQIQQAYGETNMNTLYQQAAKLAQGAQGLTQQATQDFSGLVQQAGDNQARLAEYFVKAAAAERLARTVAKAVEPQPQMTSQTTIQGTVQQSAVSSPADDTPAFMASVARPLCASCHSGQKLEGKFDIESYPRLSMEQKAMVWDRLTTSDLSKRMPRDLKDKTKHGALITKEQLLGFYRH
jgi:hypothetical protein